VQLVRAGRAGCERLFQQGCALGDLGRVPSVPVLVAERDEAAGVADPRRPARVRDQQQCEQAGDLRLVRDQRGERAGEADRLLAERTPDQVRAEGMSGLADRQRSRPTKINVPKGGLLPAFWYIHGRSARAYETGAAGAAAAAGGSAVGVLLAWEAAGQDILGERAGGLAKQAAEVGVSLHELRGAR
jgi:hypothetical protein